MTNSYGMFAAFAIACAITLTMAMPSGARAQDNNKCALLVDQDGNEIAWRCELPAPPALGPPKCWMPSAGVLLCPRPIGQPVESQNVVKPANCGYRRTVKGRAGEYVCW